VCLEQLQQRAMHVVAHGGATTDEDVGALVNQVNHRGVTGKQVLHVYLVSSLPTEGHMQLIQQTRCLEALQLLLINIIDIPVLAPEVKHVGRVADFLQLALESALLQQSTHRRDPCTRPYHQHRRRQQLRKAEGGGAHEHSTGFGRHGEQWVIQSLPRARTGEFESRQSVCSDTCMYDEQRPLKTFPSLLVNSVTLTVT
jgi:hypothetical protein